MPSHAATSTTTALLDHDAIHDLLRFVAEDHRYESIGMRGAVGIVLERRLGVPLDAETVRAVTEAFWDACEACLGDA